MLKRIVARQARKVRKRRRECTMKHMTEECANLTQHGAMVLFYLPTRDIYSPLRVSMRMTSPSSMNMGT